MKERRFTPLAQSFTGHKIMTPSRLADLNGGRMKGRPINVERSKPPKLRFKPGDLFEFDGETWELIYCYRVAREPGIWHHCVETRKVQRAGPTSLIASALIGLGAGATTPRIVYEAFKDHQDASQFFSDIYRLGDGEVKTTQELLKIKKV